MAVIKSFSNGTKYQVNPVKAMVSLEAMITSLVVLAISLVLINSFTIRFTLRIKQLRKPTRLSILSLLLVHLLQGLIVAPSYAIERSSLHSVYGVCELFQFSHSYTHYVCSLNVLVFSLDRFFGVQYPLQYKSWVTKTRMLRLLVLIWVYVFLLCLLPFLPHGSNHHCYYYQPTEWILGMLIMHILIPLILTCICYAITFQKMMTLARRQKFREFALKASAITVGGVVGSGSENGRHDVRSNSSSERYEKKIKKCKFTLLIVGVYILTWVPNLCYDLLLVMCKVKCFPTNYYDKHASYDGSVKKETVDFVITVLTLSDGLISPIIYCSTEGKKILIRTFRKGASAIRKRFSSDADCRQAIITEDELNHKLLVDYILTNGPLIDMRETIL